MRRRLAAVGAAAAAAATACASPGVPPGGPVVKTPPKLVRISPESGAVNVRPREVVFEYSAVISETPRGGAAASTGGGNALGLAGIVLVSPRSGATTVDWRREQIAVRVRRGFRPNVTYTVTVLPGVQDLRNNVRDTASVAVFSTGGAIARASIRGTVFDWANGKPAARAVVEATGADSVTYVTLADSVGRFVLRGVPPGAYLVRGTVDVSANFVADPREPFDTVRGAAALSRPAPDTGGLAIYAFGRDSIRPVLTGVSVVDSVTLRVAFDRPLRPDQAFGGLVRVTAADSARVAVRAVYTGAVADSIARAETAAPRDSTGRRDSAGVRPPPRPPGPARPPIDDADPRRALENPGAGPGPAPRRPGARGGARDTTPPPRLLRPVPPTELVIRVAAPLRPSTTYRVRIADVRTLAGITGTVERTVTTPRPAPPRPAAAPAAPPAAPPGAPPAAPRGTRPPR